MQTSECVESFLKTRFYVSMLNGNYDASPRARGDMRAKHSVDRALVLRPERT